MSSAAPPAGDDDAGADQLPAETAPVEQQPLPGMSIGDEYEVVEQRSQLHVGPLPAPESLAAYNRIDPTFAERIFAMAEREQGHRHEIERTETNEPFRIARRGQAIALVVVGLVLAFGVYLVAAGSPVAGSIIVGVDLVGLVAVFVTGQLPVRRAEDPPKIRADGEAPEIDSGENQ